MGGIFSPKSTKTTSTNAPPQYIQSALQNLTSTAQNVASQPLRQYQGQIVAPFSNLQNQAFIGLGGINNAAQPYINQAQGLATAGANPVTPMQFSANAVNQYQSPYTQDVVAATQNQFNLANAQQQNQLVGNAASQGALGGDRIAVAQAQRAGQQQAQ